MKVDKQKYLVACRFELPSSKSASGDGANDRDVFVKPVVKLDVVVLSISLQIKSKHFVTLYAGLSLCYGPL